MKERVQGKAKTFLEIFLVYGKALIWGMVNSVILAWNLQDVG